MFLLRSVLLLLIFDLLISHHLYFFFLFFFNDTATTEIYTLSLHDALPIFYMGGVRTALFNYLYAKNKNGKFVLRSEEHTSELQSRPHLVCRLLLEKKKKNKKKKN